MKVYFPVKKRSRPDPSYSLAGAATRAPPLRPSVLMVVSSAAPLGRILTSSQPRIGVQFPGRRPGCHFSIAIDRAREERLTKQARTTQQQTCVACGQLRGEDGGPLRLLHLREAGQSSPAGLPFRS
jgi:hypothetical protein